MDKKVGIVLVNYKDYARRFLEDCRDSLRAQDYPSELTRFYVVDNASTPETEEYLRENFPEAVIVPRPDGNYCAANNLGLSQAAAGCDYLVTVNMDTRLAPGWLSGLVRALDDNPEAAIAQSKILLFPRTEEEKARPRLNSLGNAFHFLGFGFTIGYGEPDREVAGYPEIKGYASGCSFAIRSSVWQELGGYYEDFYMYHDDVEISLKARLAGYRIILAPQSVIYHKYEFSRSVQMLYYIERNRLITLLSFYPWPLLVLVSLPALLVQAAMLPYALLGGWLRTALAVDSYFLRPSTYVKIYGYRRGLRRLAKVPFRDLASGFSARIEFQEITNPLLRYVANPLMDAYWKAIRKLA